MRNQIRALFTAVCFTLASTGASHAMSSLVSLSKVPLWPTNAVPDSNCCYYVTAVGRAGSGLLLVNLTATNLPPGVTVTFTPSVLRFTGNQLTSQTAKMTISCPCLMPTDCYPFTITATDQRGESLSVTNQVCFAPDYVESRPATLICNCPTNGCMNLQGLGATGKTYQMVASPSVSDPVWTPLSTSIADGNGRFFIPPQAMAGFPMRFFRTVTTQ